MNFFNNLKIRLTSEKVGNDEFGNVYYEAKSQKPFTRKKRFVIYNGIAEASKIPAEWHLWLHYTTDNIPVNINTHKYAWQKIHLPNLTGTKNAFFPLGSENRGGKRSKVGSDYQAWEPKNNIEIKEEN